MSTRSTESPAPSGSPPTPPLSRTLAPRSRTATTAPRWRRPVWFQGDEAPELWTLDPNAAPADTPGRRANLPAVLLHHHLLKTTGVPIEAATDGSIAYEANPDDIVALLERAEITAGVFLPPMTPKQFSLATEDGDLLPPKSTRFLPKLVSGLVWCGHDAKVVSG